MYTQCPHCDLAFRVTAPDLQRASGKVSCAGCSREFNALERLTEDPPAVAGVEDDPDSLLDTLNEFAGGHEIRIEDTGVEWRVIDEDEADEVDEVAAKHTDEPGVGGDGRAGRDAEPSAYFDLDVQRYDDNTPLPEDFVEEEPQVFKRRAEDQVEPRAPEADEAQVDLALGEPDDWMDLLDEVAHRSEAAESVEDREAGAVGPEAPLKLAITDTDAHDIASPIRSPSTQTEEPPAQAEQEGLDDTNISALAEDDEEPVADDFPSDIDTQFDLQALEMGIDVTGSHNLALEQESSPEEFAPKEIGQEGTGQEEIGHEQTSKDQREENVTPGEAPPRDTRSPGNTPARTMRDEGSAQEADVPVESQHYVPPQTEEEMTINRLIDQDLIRLAEQQNLFTSGTHNRIDDAPHVETIIMEGDLVRNALEAELATGLDSDGHGHLRSGGRAGHSGTAKADASHSPQDEDDILDTYARSTDSMRGGRRGTDPASYKVIAGVAALALLLAAQVVHAWRDSLATYPVFDKTIGSVYRLLGEPVKPGWNIKDWQFEATSGRTGETDDVLTISSRVANGSSRALPYPLLHVSLTDRWEEIIGTRILEPRDYLDGNADSGTRVPPGERFTAVVRIEAPSPEATGFKLNVCYREPGNRVRCATEDFKN